MRLLLLLLCAGCASSSPKGEELITDVRTFQEGLRWRRYDEAADHVPAASRERFLDAHDELDADLRVDDYEVMRVTLHDKASATVRVRYTWHRDTVGRVFETVFDEEWQKQGKVWRIVSAEKRSGEPMPDDVLPEAAIDAGPSAGR